MKQIRTAVSIPLASVYESTGSGSVELAIPLLDRSSHSHDHEEDNDEQQELTLWHKTVNFLTGSWIGMALSFLGFHVLVNHASITLWSRLQVVLFALTWSSITGLVAYLSFMAVHVFALNTPTAVWTKLEFHFAQGVFLGFCSACVLTDIIYGFPVRSVLLMVAVSLSWPILMIACDQLTSEARERPQKGHTSSTGTITTASNKGTMLPMVMV